VRQTSTGDDGSEQLKLVLTALCVVTRDGI